MTRHYHDRLSAGVPMPSFDVGDEEEMHVHVAAMTPELFSVVLHDHDGYEASRQLVGAGALAKALAHLAAQGLGIRTLPEAPEQPGDPF